MADLKVALEDLREESDSRGLAETPVLGAGAPVDESRPRRGSRWPQSEHWRSARGGGDSDTAGGRTHDPS